MALSHFAPILNKRYKIPVRLPLIEYKNRLAPVLPAGFVLAAVRLDVAVLVRLV
jgi:hypothetical protein